MENYMMTGNNVPINKSELVAHVKLQLEEYTKAPVKPNFNPFENPIIYKTSDGKMIQIPQDIQMNVIKEWQEHKRQNNNNNNSQVNGNISGFDIQPQADVDYGNADLGLHNQDDRFTSSVRPFSRFDSFDMPNSSQMLSDRTFALDDNFNKNNSIISNNNPVNVPTNIPVNNTINYSISKPINSNMGDYLYKPPIIEKEIEQSNNNNVYYILLLIIIVIGGMYLLKHKE